MEKGFVRENRPVPAALSRRPGQFSVPDPPNNYKAWLGVRFRTPEDDEEGGGKSLLRLRASRHQVQIRRRKPSPATLEEPPRATSGNLPATAGYPQVYQDRNMGLTRGASGASTSLVNPHEETSAEITAKVDAPDAQIDNYRL